MSKANDQKIVKSNSGTYVLQDFLGKGTQGKVYQVLKQEDNKQYVLKIQLDLNEREMKFIDCLKANFQHFQGFTRFYEYFESGASYYIVQELCQGGDLRKLLKEREAKKTKPIFEKMEIYNIVSDVTEALIQLQAMELYHRDIKPENILIFCDPETNSTKYKLCDCGLLKDAKDKNITKDVGTCAYQAYEIVQNKVYDNKCDIWSLGAVIFELYNELPLFDGQHKEASEQIKNTNNAKLKEIINGLDCDKSMKDLLSSMLDTNPEKRPNLQQIQQQIQAIKRVEEELQKLVKILTDFRQIQDDADINQLENQEQILKDFLAELEKPFPQLAI